ncbi:MAG: hypothetical protein ACXWLW_12290 [Rhizomicrobium sp.]
MNVGLRRTHVPARSNHSSAEHVLASSFPHRPPLFASDATLLDNSCSASIGLGRDHSVRMIFLESRFTNCAWNFSACALQNRTRASLADKLWEIAGVMKVAEEWEDAL